MDLNESASFAEDYWYDDVKFSVLMSLMSDSGIDVAEASAGTVIDIGCGTGGIAGRLNRCSNGGQVVAFDPALTHFVRNQLSELGIQPVTAFPAHLRDHGDLVLLMDVLEHVPDPGSLLRDAERLLAPAGKLVVTVPAYRWLWSSHDVALGHYDRYTLSRLRALMAGAVPQLRVDTSGYFLSTLMLGAAAPRLIDRAHTWMRKERLAQESQMGAVNGWGLGNLLGTIGNLDAKLIGPRMPFGLTCGMILERR